MTSEMPQHFKRTPESQSAARTCPTCSEAERIPGDGIFHAPGCTPSAPKRDPIAVLREQIVMFGWSTLLIDEIAAERDRYREALEAIESMSGAGVSGQIPAMPIAARARKALA